MARTATTERIKGRHRGFDMPAIYPSSRALPQKFWSNPRNRRTLARMTQPVTQDQRTFRFFAVYLLSFYVVWISWALLLVRHPTLNQDGILRAVIRLLIWVAPACAFVRWVEGPPLLVRLGLRDGIWRGILIGLVGFLPVAALIVVEHGPSIQNFRLPANAAAWLNPILSAPF